MEMEMMTKDMSEIARKTKTETVSMKIITLVTLFFLPGTFIAVSCSLFLWRVSHSITLQLSTPYRTVLSTCCTPFARKSKVANSGVAWLFRH